VKIRFFSSSSCKDCLELFVLLAQYDVNYEFIDAMAKDEDIQSLCDEQNVDELPHLQIMHNDRVLSEHIGPLTEKELLKFCGRFIG